jgi:hypothetical protein
VSAAVSLSTIDEPTPEQDARAMLHAAISVACKQAGECAEAAEVLADLALDVAMRASAFAARAVEWNAVAVKYARELAARGDLPDPVLEETACPW